MTTVANTRPPSSFARTMAYTGRSILIQLRNAPFVIFTIALPIAIFLMMQQIYAVGPQAGMIRRYMMVSMAAYGGLGAAMNAGTAIQSERSTGWFRQLMITALRPAEFLIGKILVAITVILPAIVIVYAIAAALGVSAGFLTMLASASMLLLTLIPMILLGLALSLMLKPAAAQAASTLLLLVLSMLGGLWVPIDFFPRWMVTLAKCLPTYWINTYGRWTLDTSAAFRPIGILVICGWAAVFMVAGSLFYTRAARNSSR